MAKPFREQGKGWHPGIEDLCPEKTAYELNLRKSESQSFSLTFRVVDLAAGNWPQVAAQSVSSGLSSQLRQAPVSAEGEEGISTGQRTALRLVTAWDR